MRGGKRTGAGRPKGTTKKKIKKMVSMRLSPDVINWLQKQDQSQAKIVEGLIREEIAKRSAPLS